MINIILLIFGIITLTSLLFNIKLYNKITELNNQVNTVEQELRKTLDDAKELIEIEAGDNAIISDYRLETKGDNPIKFGVTYEVEILEVSLDNVKVKAIDYQSNDSYANDPANKQPILNFINGKWFNKSEVEILIDEKKKRNIKLSKLGI